MVIEPGRVVSARRSSATGALRAATALATLAALAAPTTVTANPAILFVDGGAGGALLPQHTEDVRIASEWLEFTEHAQEDASADWSRARLRLPWHVRADYVLENLTDARVEAEVGFPVAEDRGTWDQNASMEADPESNEPLVWWPSGRRLQPFTSSFHVRLDGGDLAYRTVQNDCPVSPNGKSPAPTGAVTEHGAQGPRGYRSRKGDRP